MCTEDIYEVTSSSSCLVTDSQNSKSVAPVPCISVEEALAFLSFHSILEPNFHSLKLRDQTKLSHSLDDDTLTTECWVLNYMYTGVHSIHSGNMDYTNGVMCIPRCTLEPSDGSVPEGAVVEKVVALKSLLALCSLILFGVEKGLELVVVKNNDTRNAMTIR